MLRLAGREYLPDLRDSVRSASAEKDELKLTQLAALFVEDGRGNEFLELAKDLPKHLGGEILENVRFRMSRPFPPGTEDYNCEGQGRHPGRIVRASSPYAPAQSRPRGDWD